MALSVEHSLNFKILLSLWPFPLTNNKKDTIHLFDKYLVPHLCRLLHWGTGLKHNRWRWSHRTFRRTLPCIRTRTCCPGRDTSTFRSGRKGWWHTRRWQTHSSGRRSRGGSRKQSRVRHLLIKLSICFRFMINPRAQELKAQRELR